jgi:ubiquitin carboxyl-terminal hydrolase L3
MADFLEQCEGKSILLPVGERCLTLSTGKSPAERGDLLKATFSNIHADSAVSGQTVAPTDPAIEPEGHFICFVQAPEAGLRQRASDAAVGVTNGDDSKTDGLTGMRLVELNGSRRGPIDRGECESLLHVRHLYWLLSITSYACVDPRIQQSL